MKHALAPVAALLVSVAILLTGSGLQGTLLPVRAVLENFSTLAIGTMGAAYFLGFTVGCLRGGELVKSVGHVRVFLAMTALGSATPLVHGLVLHPLSWGFLRFLTGFCFAVLYLVIESWLNERSTNETRGIVFSTYVMITLTVMAVGQMMTLMYEPSGLELFVIASVLVSLGALPVALSKSESPVLPQETNVNLRLLFRISPAAVVGCLATGIANGAFWSFAPVFATGVSGDSDLAAWFMTSTVIGGALSQWPLGFVSDKIGRRKTLMIASVTGALVATAIVWTNGAVGFAGINLLGAAWGFCAFPLYSISVAHANDHAETSDYVIVSSSLLLTYGAGAIFGPFVASAIMSVTNSSGLYILTGMAHVSVATYVLFRIFRRDSVPSAKHMDFGDALATTATVSQVYDDEIQYQAEEERSG